MSGVCSCPTSTLTNHYDKLGDVRVSYLSSKLTDQKRKFTTHFDFHITPSTAHADFRQKKVSFTC